MTALPWESEPPDLSTLPLSFFGRDVAVVARDLLGALLVSSVGGQRTAGIIVETEAYGGPEDAASHAATRQGPTERNRAMFGPPGRAYIYRSYGVHWCMNVVTGMEGQAQAVLLRGLEPWEGRSVMAQRRGRRTLLAAGPGRLCQALAIDDALYGHDLSAPPLRLLAGWRVPADRVCRSGRVGVSVAAGLPLRFFVAGSPGVTPTARRTKPARSDGPEVPSEGRRG